MMKFACQMRFATVYCAAVNIFVDERMVTRWNERLHLTKRQVQGCQLFNKTNENSHAPTRQIGGVFLSHDVNETLLSRLQHLRRYTALKHMQTQCVRGSSRSLTCHADKNLKMRTHSSFPSSHGITHYRKHSAKNNGQQFIFLECMQLFFCFAFLILTYLCCSIIKTNSLFVCGSRLRIFVI